MVPSRKNVEPHVRAMSAVVTFLPLMDKCIGPASGRARDYAVGLCMQEGKEIGILTSVG